MSIKAVVFTERFILKILIGKCKSPIRIVVPPFPRIETVSFSIVAQHKSFGMVGYQMTQVRIMLHYGSVEIVELQ